MGMLLYGVPPHRIVIDDRTLAHLESVIIAKLRRSETFAFRWVRDSSAGAGRGTFMLSGSVPLAFEYEGNRRPTLNPEWIAALTLSANSAHGLEIVPEGATADGATTTTPLSVEIGRSSLAGGL